MHNSYQHIRLLLGLPFVVVIIGTLGFMAIEGLSFLDAFYFTIVTISTVGYGDIHPTNIASKMFGIVVVIIGIGTFLTIVTNLTQMLIHRRHNRLRMRRLNMIIGVFFTEVGNELLRILTQYDAQINDIRNDCLLSQDCSDIDFSHLRLKLKEYEYEIDPQLMDLEILANLLNVKGDLLLRQLENPDLIEHESFSELLWAIVHFRDELLLRQDLTHLPKADLAHLSNDAKRVYGALARQWVNYLQHLKRNYPYLFSLAIRANPFGETSSVIVE